MPSAFITTASAERRHEERTKRMLRALTAASFSEEFVCSITCGLMVDPVVAEDRNTYERSAILEWLKTKKKSPLNPSQTLRPSCLLGNRAVLGCIEKMIVPNTIDEELRSEWFTRKKLSDLEKAQDFYDKGKVLEAAKLGLPKAQEMMAEIYCTGKSGFEKDLIKILIFAKQAAE